MSSVFPADRVLIIAEAGVNHNGDMELARQLVAGAAEAGADAVKFQLFDPKVLLVKSAPMADYQVKNVGKEGPKSQYQMLEELALPKEAFKELQAYADQHNILFLCSPFDEASSHYLHEVLKVPCLKIASGEITNKPFLEDIGRMNIPVILSTGMATLDEVKEAVSVLRSAQAAPSVQLSILHCVTSYPAPFDALNLNAIQTLRETFPDCIIGYSDHSVGTHIPVAAVAVGARVVEKHFTLDQSLPGPDHKASLTVPQLREMVRHIRDVEASLGNGEKVPNACEINCRGIARKSLVAKTDLPKGHTITYGDLAVKRPGSGISPMLIDSVVGKTLVNELKEDDILTPSDINPAKAKHLS